MDPKKKVSCLFLAHGSPLLAIEEKEFVNFLATLGRRKPKAVIVFTAHWETEVTRISCIEGIYDMIYDFRNFPKALYEMKYPAKGSPELANKIQQILKNHGIQSELDKERGQDHGTWTLLYRIFPEADIPVVQMSVNPDSDPETQYAIGKALRDLDDDYLVIGSGVTVHNLRKLTAFDDPPVKWALDFDDWIIDKTLKKDYNSIFKFMTEAPNAKIAVPTPEHFVPYLIALGCSDPSRDPKVIYRGYEEGSLSYLCFEFA